MKTYNKLVRDNLNRIKKATKDFYDSYDLKECVERSKNGVVHHPFAKYLAYKGVHGLRRNECAEVKLFNLKKDCDRREYRKMIFQELDCQNTFEELYAYVDGKGHNYISKWLEYINNYIDEDVYDYYNLIKEN